MYQQEILITKDLHKVIKKEHILTPKTKLVLTLKITTQQSIILHIISIQTNTLSNM